MGVDVTPKIDYAVAREAYIHYCQNVSGVGGGKYPMGDREAVESEYQYIYHLYNAHYWHIFEVSLNLSLVGRYNLLDSDVEPLYLWHMLNLGYSVDTDLQRV